MPRRKQLQKRKKGTVEKKSLDHVKKYDILKAIATAGSGISFGQLAGRDDDEAKTKKWTPVDYKKNKEVKNCCWC